MTHYKVKMSFFNDFFDSIEPLRETNGEPYPLIIFQKITFLNLSSNVVRLVCRMALKQLSFDSPGVFRLETTQCNVLDTIFLYFLWTWTSLFVGVEKAFFVTQNGPPYQFPKNHFFELFQQCSPIGVSYDPETTFNG